MVETGSSLEVQEEEESEGKQKMSCRRGFLYCPELSEYSIQGDVDELLCLALAVVEWITSLDLDLAP